MSFDCPLPLPNTAVRRLPGGDERADIFGAAELVLALVAVVSLESTSTVPLVVDFIWLFLEFLDVLPVVFVVDCSGVLFAARLAPLVDRCGIADPTPWMCRTCGCVCQSEKEKETGIKSFCVNCTVGNTDGN
jgi:hypothetical protein